uniref:Uncharacterized protein n=1 Tax=Rhizophora mucronata TaxID=61149 RepID=A0A2P2M0X5_RHIMU
MRQSGWCKTILRSHFLQAVLLVLPGSWLQKVPCSKLCLCCQICIHEGEIQRG